MATQITVAVGANEEVLGALTMRDGARADRLDSEATKKQARQAAAEQVGDDSQGRENKLGKSGVGRDPAAFARKKKPQEGQFVGVNIFYEYFALINRWDIYQDHPFLWLTVRGTKVDADGNASLVPLENATKIELDRNNNTEAFSLSVPTGYEQEDYFPPLYESYKSQFYGCYTYWPLFKADGSSSGQFYKQEGFRSFPCDAYAVDPNRVPGLFFIWKSGFTDAYQSTQGTSTMVPLNMSSSFDCYLAQAGPQERFDFPQEGYLRDGLNGNLRVNGRTEEDNTITGYSNFRQDPVHEVFLLPYTGETTFLVTVITDYMIGTRAWLRQSAQVVAEDNGPAPSGDDEGKHTNTVKYSRQRPSYYFPEGYEIPEYLNGDFENQIFPYPNPDPVITEKGANKIQEIKLFKIVNGEVTEVEKVPQKLRDAAAGLQSNLEGQRIPTAVRKNTYKEYASLERTAYFSARGVEIIMQDGDDMSSWLKFDATCDIYRFHIGGTLNRKYLENQTRERSVSKGFGFGKLSTNNHFDSKYIDSESKGFWDDKYFTPMIYSYLKGQAHPGMTYPQGSLGMPRDPETDAPFSLGLFVDHDGYDQVRFTETPPTAINVPADGSFTAWEKIPQLKFSTHQCWNWNRPDLCWVELDSLGFGTDLIGDRPPPPES